MHSSPAQFNKTLLHTNFALLKKISGRMNRSRQITQLAANTPPALVIGLRV
jgi:hypothetical protein